MTSPRLTKLCLVDAMGLLCALSRETAALVRSIARGERARALWGRAGLDRASSEEGHRSRSAPVAVSAWRDRNRAIGRRCGAKRLRKLARAAPKGEMRPRRV